MHNSERLLEIAANALLDAGDEIHKTINALEEHGGAEYQLRKARTLCHAILCLADQIREYIDMSRDVI